MPDFHEITNPEEPALRDLDVLVLDMLRYTPHPTHASFAESLAVIDRFRPRRAFFTHLCHDVDHATLCERLHKMGRDEVRPAYDGLEIQIG
jgi:phosphoribosyl 1,2-cyclic phosphate phosphodiesterase